jgi:hypothetical protein
VVKDSQSKLHFFLDLVAFFVARKPLK